MKMTTARRHLTPTEADALRQILLTSDEWFPVLQRCRYTRSTPRRFWFHWFNRRTQAQVILLAAYAQNRVCFIPA